MFHAGRIIGIMKEHEVGAKTADLARYLCHAISHLPTVRSDCVLALIPSIDEITHA
jgi:hypothetical protein